MPRSSATPRSLAPYIAKRDFSISPEPPGKGKAAARRTRTRQLRFCVQKHLASHLHYDFRLEHGGALLSWAVPKGPSLNPKDKRLARQVEDHPVDYGDFEGVIPEGYGAGIVMLWDRGIWRPEDDDIDAAMKKGELRFTLDGVKLKGAWVLVRTGQDPRNWLLIKRRDGWAGDLDVTEAAPLSVKSFGDLADILAQDQPRVWESHLPAKGGAAGAMLREVIAEAAKRISSRRGRRASKKPKPSLHHRARSKMTSSSRRLRS